MSDKDGNDTVGNDEDGSDSRPESLLPYDRWMEDSLRGVVLRALRHVIEEGGLPGEHHFYITFRTGFPGVVLPARLLAKYPDEMTIVLQHQFEKLHVDEAAGLFGITLSFGGVSSPLVVPIAAVSAFVDPYVQYGLRFRVAAPAPVAALPQPEVPPADDAAAPQVVSLDAFRRKRD